MVLWRWPVPRRTVWALLIVPAALGVIWALHTCGTMKTGDWISLVVGGVVLWYTIETRLLRKQSGAQLEELRYEARLRALPSLVVGARVLDDHQAREFIHGIRGLRPEEVQARIERFIRRPRRFACTVTSNNDAVAEDASAVLYDAVERRFLLSDQGADIIPARGSFDFSFTGEYVTAEVARRALAFAIGPASRHYEHLLVEAPEFHVAEGEEEFYVLVFFRDIAGRLYVRARPFRLNSAGGVGQRRGRLHFSKLAVEEPLGGTV